MPADSILSRDVSLRPLNAFGLESSAERFARVEDEATLRAVLEALDPREPLTILGGGTNVVLMPRLPGCVLHLAVRGITRCEAGEDVLVTAAAGESWHGLVRYCVGQGLAGIENLALIPGSVGAAPIQNIGAYGTELSRCVERVTAMSRATGELHSFSGAECQFGYRDSAFKSVLRDQYLIVAVTLRLRRQWEPILSYPDVEEELRRMAAAPTLAHVADAIIRVRRRKLPDPRTVGNAGSFFKNPVVSREVYGRLCAELPDLAGFPDGMGVKVSAARLIDACGWKGRSMGGARVWFRQPLVLVNAGGATARDVLGLADAIRDSVRARFGVSLEREVRVIGADD